MKARFKHSHAAPHSTTAAERKAFQNVHFSDPLTQSPENPGSCRFSFCKGICPCATFSSLNSLKHVLFRCPKAKHPPWSGACSSMRHILLHACPPCRLRRAQPWSNKRGRQAPAPPLQPAQPHLHAEGFYNPKHRASASPGRALATASFAVLLQKMLMKP